MVVPTIGRKQTSNLYQAYLPDHNYSLFNIHYSFLQSLSIAASKLRIRILTASLRNGQDRSLQLVGKQTSNLYQAYLHDHNYSLFIIQYSLFISSVFINRRKLRIRILTASLRNGQDRSLQLVGKQTSNLYQAYLPDHNYSLFIIQYSLFISSVFINRRKQATNTNLDCT